MNKKYNNIDMKTKAYGICQKFLSGPWKCITLDEFGFEQLRGGITNILYRCKLPEHAYANSEDSGNEDIPKEVLMRIYGPMHESTEAAVQDTVIFTILSEKKLGPKLYGIFDGGRLEEYVPSRAANWDDFSNTYISVAEEMAKTHALQMPIAKDSILQKYLQTIINEVQECKSIQVPEIISSGEFRKEATWVQNEIDKIDTKVVFCHNDLLGGNILMLHDNNRFDNKKVLLIDFEFSGYNYRGFDISDYFCENCFLYKTMQSPYNFEVDFGKYPSESQQIAFADAYVNQLQKEGVKLKHTVEIEKQKLLKEIAILSLAANLFCSACSFKMSINPPVDFPFRDHAFRKWEAYQLFKKRAIQNGFLISN